MTGRIRGAWKPLLAATTTAATLLVGTALTTSPAQSAVMTGDCATPFPVADIATGDAVHGLTVTHGTVPESFTGEVLGVYQDAIAPDLDMVMVRLTSTEIDRVGGIWAGMSGSPVYAADGRLIGAVAYGLSWGPSPVAGVTPFEEMDNYMPAPAKVKVPSTLAKSIARTTDVTAAQAGLGLSRLPLVRGVSGVSSSRLVKPSKAHPYLWRKATVAGGGGTSGAATVADIVAGGNLALTVAYGDVDLWALGTATSVCGTAVVGFGHPAAYLGKTTFAMHPADAIYIQEDTLGGSFKVANIADPVGTITDDHLAGITGTTASLPTTFPVTDTATYGTKSRTGVSHVSMKRWAASTTYYQLAGNQDRILDGYIPGSEELSWVIKGTSPKGPFTIDMSDRYVSEFDINDAASWTVPDLVYFLTSFKGVTLSEVTMDGTIADDTSTLMVKELQYKQGPSWVTVKPRGRVFATAGTTLKLRVVVEDEAGATQQVPVSVAIPAKLAKARGELSVIGGNSMEESYWDASTVSELLTAIGKSTRNDQIVVGLDAFGPRGEVSTQTATAPQANVVSGYKFFRLIVS